MNQILKLLLQIGLKKKLEEKKLKKAEEEEPEAKKNRKLVVLAVGLGVGAAAGLCVVKSLKALRKAQMEKALEELDAEEAPSPVIKLPEEILDEEAPQPEPEA